MDVDLLEQIIRLMTDHDLNTVDVRDGDKRVVLKRGVVVAPHAGAGFAPAPQYLAPPVSPQPTPGLASGGTTSAGATAPPSADDANLVPINSPMVGTFYAAPSPEAKPFVAVGAQVDEETDVCVIEAMKVFNNIKAETRGTIARILVSNGQTVEYGQTLFLVKP